MEHVKAQPRDAVRHIEYWKDMNWTFEKSQPKGFRSLDPSIQERILREGAAVGQEVVRHCAQVLIGPPISAVSSAPINHASAVQFTLGNGTYVATAAHVVEQFEKRKLTEDLRFQVGNVVLRPEERIVYRNADHDVAILRLESRERADIAASIWSPPMWPPTQVLDDDYVAFAGYPTEYRLQPGPSAVILHPIGGLMRVGSASDRRVVSPMDRSKLVAARGLGLPQRGANMGGMSGGPVFVLRDWKPELIGVITDFGEDFETFFFGTFIGWDPR